MEPPALLRACPHRFDPPEADQWGKQNGGTGAKQGGGLISKYNFEFKRSKENANRISGNGYEQFRKEADYKNSNPADDHGKSCSFRD